MRQQRSPTVVPPWRPWPALKNFALSCVRSLQQSISLNMVAKQCSGAAVHAYDMPLHILAVFLIAFFSFLGAVLPLIAFWVPRLQVPENLLVAGNFFGVGVVISTAFVHMIPEAMAALNNPCLGSIGNAYAPFPLVIVMGTMFAMQLMEFFLTRKMMASAEKSWKAAVAAEAEAEKPAASPALAAAAVSGVDTEEAGTLAAIPLHSPTANTLGQHQLAETSDCDRCPRPAQVHADHAGCAHHSMEHLKEFDVAESRGPGFKTLLTALVFHQFFEGFALGSAVSSIGPSRLTALSTVCGYVLSTPLGVALGIVIRSSYNQNSKSALWTEGTFNAVSGGTLIYAGIVELMTYGMTISPKFSAKVARKSTVATAFISMYIGAAAMSIVGKWA
eukprot:10745-Heterococcus_DN1.PRE.3